MQETTERSVYLHALILHTQIEVTIAKRKIKSCDTCEKKRDKRKN